MQRTDHAEEPERSSGRLGVLIPGLGSVATTFAAGLDLIRRGETDPVGSLTQLGVIRDAAGEKARRIKDIVPLSSVGDIVVGGWDVVADDGYEAARAAGVLSEAHLESARECLRAIEPMAAVFDPRYVSRLEGSHVKSYTSLREAAELVREDIREFKRVNGLDRVVMISCASTEAYAQPRKAHHGLEDFERALEESDPAISPAMIYAYAAIREGVPYANGAPSLAVEIPALLQLAAELGVPVAGKDFKTGQTLIKTILAPGIRARALGLEGWFSTNLLGNRDGMVLEDPESHKSKEVSKLSALESILDPGLYPELYESMSHTVDINYYPPRGDAKEGWDNADLTGWLGYPMQIKINLLARDSILAAPLVLDLALLLDLARRSGMGGVQDWLSFYFKSPMTPEGLHPEHDLFRQLHRLEQELVAISEVS
ncbi:inositol-3-phosphate synthase [Rubrobacter aplysinae]|uniref:inositol-3-phosphate synthase n=1 Tax=Rubrobacter aplysinae TaxID=909625 RepID=UPI00064C1DBD|nr:inositol-3-phosphate synthase [Rubrobacter aplysinae]